MIEFRGHTLNPDDVLGVGYVSIVSTGSLHCDWDFGFNVYQKTKNVMITISTETDQHGNHKLNQYERRKVAQQERRELMKLLKFKPY